MSKPETEVPERLREAGATNLERRLLDAASREQPSRELSERMAQAIGISISPPGTAQSEAAKTGKAATTTQGPGSLVPWLSGALVAAGVAAGAYVATHPGPIPPTPSALAALPAAASASSSASRSLAPTPTAEAPPGADDEASPKVSSPIVPQRGRRVTAAGELANQIALVDSARSALSAGKAERALSAVSDYQSQYPNGAFRPEVAAVKIEALVKMGRTAEARAAAERFVVAYGPGPLADRVARLARIAEP